MNDNATLTPAAAQIPGVEYAIVYRFGEHAGGDVADVFDCGSGITFISLADIEGHGQDAAVHAALVKYGIRAYAGAHRHPSQVLQNLNALYARDCRLEGAESFASLFLALVEPDGRSMTYVSAGYEAALLLHPNGFSNVLPVSGGDRTIMIAPGSTLLAVSDGVTDARLGRKRFGLARIRHLLSDRAAAGPYDLAQDVMAAACAFCRGNIADDMAVVAVRFSGDR